MCFCHSVNKVDFSELYLCQNLFRDIPETIGMVGGPF